MLKSLLNIAAVAVVAAATASAQAPPAEAQTMFCAQRDNLVELLKAQYEEKQRGFGLADQRTVVELYVGPNGSWTLMLTKSTGVSCVLGSGDDWQDTNPPVPEIGAEANPARLD